MTILRPVTQCLPKSITVSEQSNLPFSFVLSPYAKNSLLSSSNKSNEQQKQDQEKFVKEENKNKELSSVPLLPADSVPKCGACGAPINPCSLIQSYPAKPTRNATRVLQRNHGNGQDIDDNEYDYDSSEEDNGGEEASCYGSFLCTLCGNTTSLHPNIQAAMHPGRVGKELYLARFQENARKISKALEEKQQQFEQNGGWRSRINLRNERRHQNEDTSYIHRYFGSDLYPECKNHIMEFSVPLFNSNSSAKPIMEMNGKDCPTVLTAIIFDHGPNKDFPGYYSNVCQSIRLAVENAPPHAKIAIFLATYGNITSFDLSSSTPHLKHIPLPQNKDETNHNSQSEPYSYKNLEGDTLLEDELQWNQTHVSCTTENKIHIEAVLRALEDSLVVNAACRPHCTNHTKKIQIPNLGLVLHHLFNYLECGRHPGDLLSPNTPSDPIKENDICFAGGKIMLFLPQAPEEIGDVVVEDGGYAGTGGFGGSCAKVGRRYGANREKEQTQYFDKTQNDRISHEKSISELEKEEGQINAEFMDYFLTEKKGIADWYVDLGTRAASLAMGIEIFAIQEEENNLETKSFGFPLLKILSDKSGGCGPILLCINGENAVYNNDDLESFGDSGTVATLFREVRARCPWERSCAFGGMLRIRTSPSFSVDISPPTDEDGEENSQTSHNRYHKSGGIIGPCTANPYEPDLWHFGTCDLDTTVAFDMEIISSSGELEQSVVDDDGTVMDMPPCIQTCFMYTAVIPNGKNEFKTIRRLRIMTTNLSLADNTEKLSLSLDAEALAVVLYHKMISTSLLVGLRETRTLGQNWLLAALLATYRSGERFYKAQRNRRYNVDTDDFPFYTNDRLLSEYYPTSGSTLTAREILLGEGHEFISSLPLIVFSLLNCDAIRPATKNFRPSLDARIAATASMSIMTPSMLAKAIAPRVELWSEDGKEQIIESIRMNRIALEAALHEEEEKGEMPILLLDSPWQVMLYRHIDDDKCVDTVDDAILQVVEDAVASYRVPPPVRFSLRQQDFLKQGETVSSWERFSDAMLEDLDGEVGSSSGDEMANAFELWCTKIANTLYEEIKSNNDAKNSNS